MAHIEFLDQEAARKAFAANCSLRYLRLDERERWANGTQYSDRQSWWDDTGDVPLWERAPCVIYPVVNIAARSNVDLCLGEGRFPTFTSKPGEDESDEENGLGDEDSSTLDRFIREHHKVSKFKAHSRGAFLAAQSTGSVCAIHGVRNGKPFADEVPAKWCNPEFDVDGNVTKLEIRYPYTEEYKKNGKWAKRAKLYRRVIDTDKDTEYEPADAREDGSEPDWRENKSRSVKHGLGFCPVIWYALMKGSTTVNVIDGKPIHHNLENEIQAHDIARSQWHRGALLSEPQICEIGVTPGYNPTDTGRTAVIPQSEHGNESTKLADTVVTAHLVDPKAISRKARKKGPGFAWQYQDHNTKVELLEYPEGALKAQENNCRDLRIKLQEALSVVFLDPENIKFAATTSGKALIAIKQKQLDRCDQYRDDLTDGFFEPSLSMQLRIAQSILSAGKKLRVPGASKVKAILDKLMSDDGWQLPNVRTEYGPYFRPDPDEESKIVELVQKALGAGGGKSVITLATAVKRVAKIFGVENVQAVVDELEAKAAEVAKQMQATPAPEPPNQPTDQTDDDEEEEAA